MIYKYKPGGMAGTHDDSNKEIGFGTFEVFDQTLDIDYCLFN